LSNAATGTHKPIS